MVSADNEPIMESGAEPLAGSRCRVPSHGSGAKNP